MKRKTVLEAVADVKREGNLTVDDAFNFILKEIPEAKFRTTFVKAIIPAANGADFHVYEVKGEFCWQPGIDTAVMAYSERNGEEAQQAIVKTVYDDIFAINEAQKGVFIHIAKQDGDQHFDKNTQKNVGLIFDDRTNVVFMAPYENQNKFNAIIRRVEDNVTTLGNFVDNANKVDLDDAALKNLIEKKLGIGGDEHALKAAILQMMPPAYYQHLDANLKNKLQDNDAGNDGAADLDDDIPDDAVAVDEPVAKEQPKKEEKPVAQDGKYQNINGLQYAGAWEKPNMWDLRNPVIQEQGKDNWEFAIALSPLTEEEFKQQIQDFPANAPAAFVKKPVKFVHIDNMEAPDPTHNALRYFFIFDGKTNVTWKQIRKKQTGVLRVNGVRGDLFEKMLFKNGKQWKSLFYGATSPKLKAGDFEVIFAGADQFKVHIVNGNVQAAVPVGGNSGSGDGQPKATEHLTDRDIIISRIRDRIINELVNNGFALDRSIVYKVKPAGTRKKTIVYGRDYDAANRQYVGPNRKMTAEDADKLAQQYDNWTYTGYDNAIQRKLNDVLDPNKINVAAERAKMDKNFMKPDRQDMPDDIKNVQGAVDEIMKKTGFLTATIVKDGINRRAGIPNDGKPYLDIRIPGRSDKTLTGDAAVELLTRFKMYDIVKNALDEAAKTVPEIQIIITMNNKVAI